MSLTTQQILDIIRRTVPTLAPSMYKGSCGRIGVLGGSLEYTGAPYFSAITALKIGADLSHVFCELSSATAIKSYSPDIIVHPLLRTFENKQTHTHESLCKEVEKWLPRLHVLVIGPGLGRDSFTLETISHIILKARELNLPLVIDGDGLYLICSKADLIKGYPRTVLTPNLVEYKRLWEVVFPEAVSNDVEDQSPHLLANALGNVTIIKKGQEDMISNGISSISCSEAGSNRRCCGQGDILSGSIATFIAWVLNSQIKTPEITPLMLAAYAGCLVTRYCNRKAFEIHKRSMTTTNMIEQIEHVVEHLFPTQA